MSVYSEDYMVSRDIDWFFLVNNRYPVYASSFGGRLPVLINNRERNRTIQMAVWKVLGNNTNNSQLHFNMNKIQYNEQHVENSVREILFESKENAVRNYLQPFVTMTAIGFYSFDREQLDDPTDNHYRLVSWPRHNDDGIEKSIVMDNSILQLLPNINIPDDIVKDLMDFKQSKDLVELVDRYYID